MRQPSELKAEQMSAIFGFETVGIAIRAHMEGPMVRLGDELRDNLNDLALPTFLQRVVGAFVGATRRTAASTV